MKPMVPQAALDQAKALESGWVGGWVGGLLYRLLVVGCIVCLLYRVGGWVGGWVGT